jgi:hypothetical protein
MNLKLNIPQPLAGALKSQAENSGVDVATFVIESLRAITSEHSSTPKMNRDQFKRKLQELIDAHPKNVGHIDDSRDSIYVGRGE